MNQGHENWLVQNFGNAENKDMDIVDFHSRARYKLRGIN